MTTLLSNLRLFLSEDDGNSATEYAIMLGLIVITSLAALISLGDRIVAVFQWDYASIEHLDGTP
jgi:Flp pilus assembly pilin Flp